MLKELREQLYAMMSEATDELERRSPEQCNSLLGTPTWKAYRDTEIAAGDTTDIKSLRVHLERMRHLLDQIIAL
jgi:hypothetical protein